MQTDYLRGLRIVAYLDRQLSEYKTAVPLIHIQHANVDQELEKLRPEHGKSSDDTKNNNYQLAKQLADAKQDLIKVVGHFPIVALWLINKYEQLYDALTVDVEEATSDFSVAISEIKHAFLILHQGNSSTRSNHLNRIQSQHRLILQVQLFPFSFDDLMECTELVVYQFKARGLSVALNYFNNNQVSIISKRLEQINASKSQLLQTFATTAISNYDENFLFLARNDMPKFLGDLIFAERAWLKARQALVMANNKLVSFIVNQYKGNFLDFNDLVQEGQTGLLKAVDRFDYRLGFQFSTYAGYWIRQAISRSLSRSERSVRIPCEQIANINRVFRIKDQLTAQVGREVTVQEIAAETQLSCADINHILAISQTAVPLEGNDDDESDGSFAPVDFLEQQIFTHPMEEIAETELAKLIADAIKTLNPREAKVVCSHFGVLEESGSEMTLQEIGDELHLTRERIRQIQVIALNKIKLNYGQQLISFL